jgi:hypothetical protein
MNDPLGVFPSSAISWDYPTTALTIRIDPPVPPSSYYALGVSTHYPCDLLVKTTAGARLIRIPPPPVLTQQDIDKLIAAMIVALGDCEKLVDPWFHFHGGYNPHWSVDPPVDGDYLHLWQIEIVGLQEGETVSVLDSSHHELVRARSVSGLPMNLSALLEPVVEGQELSIQRLQGPELHSAIKPRVLNAQLSTETASLKPRRGIGINQQLFLRLGNLVLPGPCSCLQFSLLLAKPCAVAAVPDRVLAFDLSNPRMPTLLTYWDTPGVKGVLKWMDRLAFFGDVGLQLLNHGAGLDQTSSCCVAEGTLDAVARAGLIYAISRGGLSAFSERLCRIHFLSMQGARCLALVDGKLLIGGDTGISIFDLSNPRSPELISSHDGMPLRRFSRAQGVGAGNVVAVLSDGSSRLLHVEGHQLQELASYPANPWLTDSFRVGKTLVRIGKTRTNLEIATKVASNLA